MKNSIWVTFSILFAGFLILVSSSVVATSLAIKRQEADIVSIYLATEQRTHIETISMGVYGIYQPEKDDHYYKNLINLENSADQFNAALNILSFGGFTTYGSGNESIFVPSSIDAEIKELLIEIQGIWARVNESVEIILNDPNLVVKSRAITNIEYYVPNLHQKSSALINLYQIEADENFNILRKIQITFFTISVGIILWGIFWIKTKIISPIQILDQVTHQIANENLEIEIKSVQKDEIGKLTRSIETMRGKLFANREIEKNMTLQLEDRVQKRTQELTSLLDISQDFSSRLGMENVLKSVVDTANELLEGEVSVLCLLHIKERILTVAGSSGNQDAITQTTAKISDGLLENVIELGNTVSHASCRECPILGPTYLQDVIVAPLISEKKAIGAICVSDYPVKNENENYEMVMSFLATMAANALENSRLYDESQTAAALAERERIAADMHDGLAQTLGYLNLKTDQALNSIRNNDEDSAENQLALMKPAIQSAYDTIRAALMNLTDKGFNKNTLQDQLSRLINEFTEKSQVIVNCDIDSEFLSSIDEKVSLQIFRIIQESLTNIQKHAQASQVDIFMNRKKNNFVLEIIDNGKGFDAANSPKNQYSRLGLKIMRGRAERVGGTLSIKSQLGKGTQIITQVPLMREINE